MPKVKVFPECVALLVDVVRSRDSQRARVHREILRAVARVNDAVQPLDPLRVTVGDELQGVYATLGEALRACHLLRSELFGVADVRCGLGGGEVRVVDATRGIQDGDAWYRAREAIERAEALASEPGRETARTAVSDGRAVATPGVDETTRLVDLNLAQLRDGARRSLIGLLAGRDNAAVAESEGISPSANSQRVNNNGLRPLADAMSALFALR